MHSKELVKLSSPPLHFTFNKKKKKEKLQKSETCIFEDVDTLTKNECIGNSTRQSIILLDIWKRTERKRPKAETKMSPEILLEKNEEKNNRKSEGERK